MAKPIPVESPPEMTTSHVLLTWRMARLKMNHNPHTMLEADTSISIISLKKRGYILEVNNG